MCTSPRYVASPGPPPPAASAATSCSRPSANPSSSSRGPGSRCRSPTTPSRYAPALAPRPPPRSRCCGRRRGRPAAPRNTMSVAREVGARRWAPALGPRPAFPSAPGDGGRRRAGGAASGPRGPASGQPRVPVSAGPPGEGRSSTPPPPPDAEPHATDEFWKSVRETQRRSAADGAAGHGTLGVPLPCRSRPPAAGQPEARPPGSSLAESGAAVLPSRRDGERDPCFAFGSPPTFAAEGRQGVPAHARRSPKNPEPGKQAYACEDDSELKPRLETMCGSQCGLLLRARESCGPLRRWPP